MKTVLSALFVCLTLTFVSPALASDIALAFISNSAITSVHEEVGGTEVTIMGGNSFTVFVNSSSQYEISDYLIYFNDVLSTTSSLTETISDCRVYHGVAVVKYSNDTYESKQFIVVPFWHSADGVNFGVAAPSPTFYILDTTSLGIINATIAADQDGPTIEEVPDTLTCDENQCCCPDIAPASTCTSDLNC